MSNGNDDPFDLARFVRAQEAVYTQVLAELRAGHKRTHWMWFVFPQLAGLGGSTMAREYAIRGRDEAAAYLAHPILGLRLFECAEALLSVSGRSAHEMLGSPDDLKLRSSATLFASVAGPGSVYQRILDRHYDGDADPRTIALLGSTA